MSLHENEIRLEQLYEEGLEEGMKKGLEGDALEFYADRYAKKYFDREVL